MSYEGFQHSATKSGFSPGSTVRALTESGFEKVIGDEGVFARNTSNGAILAIPNGASGREAAPAFTEDADTNNKAVLDYFVAAGLPATQVGRVDVTTVIAGNGVLSDGRDAPARFVAFNSVIQRQLAGIVVDESFAWARLAKDGSVVSEGVYWPEIDANIVDAAVQLRNVLADDVSKQNLVGRAMAAVPSLDYGSARAVIHHTPSWHRGAFRAYASVDATVPGPKPHDVHITAAGELTVFEYQMAPAISTPRRRR